MATVDSYFFGVTPIFPIVKGSNLHTSTLGCATGFFYNTEKNIFLITNRHVIVNEKESCFPNKINILIHDDIDVLRSVRQVEIDLYDEKMNPNWYEHSKMEDVDIIALKLDDYRKVTDVIQPWSKNEFPSISEIQAHGSRVSIIGYPRGFYDEAHNFPVERAGTIATPYGVAFNDNPYFLVDANLHPGNSGSPVIIPRTGVRPGYRTVYHRILGILSSGYDVTYLGLGIVWYPDLIQDIVTDEFLGSIRMYKNDEWVRGV